MTNCQSIGMVQVIQEVPMAFTRMAPPPLQGEWPAQGHWTYADYKQLPDDGWRYEVIGGVLYMSPSPRPKHQIASNGFATALTNFVNARQSGQVLTAPIDVILPDLASPVQPDILFIAQARLGMITDDAIVGAPDLIVEILSPSNWIDDRRTKFMLYAAAGVQEYWIVDVDRQTIDVFGLRGQIYEVLGRYTAGEQAVSRLLSGFTISVNDVCCP